MPWPTGRSHSERPKAEGDGKRRKLSSHSANSASFLGLSCPVSAPNALYAAEAGEPQGQVRVLAPACTELSLSKGPQ